MSIKEKITRFLYRTRRTIAVTALIILLLLGLAQVALDNYIPRLIRQEYLPLLAKEKDIQVNVGEIQLGRINSIVLKDIDIQHLKYSETRGRIHKASCSYNLWELLTKRKVIISNISIESPDLESASPEQLGTVLQELTARKGPPPETQDEGKVWLILQQYLVSNGRFEFNINNEKAILSNMDLIMFDRRDENRFELRLRSGSFEWAGINDKITSVKGLVELTRAMTSLKSIQLETTAGTLNFSADLPSPKGGTQSVENGEFHIRRGALNRLTWYMREFRDARFTGTADLDGTFSGPIDALKLDMVTTATGGSIFGNVFERVEMDSVWNPKFMKFNRLSFYHPEMELEMTGQIGPMGKLDLDVQTRGLNFSGIFDEGEILPLGGFVSGQGHFSGSFDSMNFKGNFDSLDPYYASWTSDRMTGWMDMEEINTPRASGVFRAGFNGLAWKGYRVDEADMELYFRAPVVDIGCLHIERGVNIVDTAGTVLFMDGNSRYILPEAVATLFKREFRNRDPIVFTLTPTGVVIEPRSLNTDDIKITYSGKWDRDDSDFRLEGKNLPLSWLGRWVAFSMNMRGRADIQFASKASLDNPKVDLNWQIGPGNVESLKWESVTGSASLRNGTVSLKNLLIDPGQGELNISGTMESGIQLDRLSGWLDSEHALNLKAAGSRINISALAYMFPGKREPGGLADFEASLGGTLGSPQIAFNTKIEKPAIDIVYGETLTLKFFYRNNRLDIQEFTVNQGNLNARANGFLPYSIDLLARKRGIIKDQSCQIYFDMTGGNLGFFESYLQPYAQFEGNFKVGLQVSGTPGNPAIEGAAEVKDGSVFIPSKYMELKEINGKFTFDKYLCQFNDVGFSFNRGNFNITGSVERRVRSGEKQAIYYARLSEWNWTVGKTHTNGEGSSGKIVLKSDKPSLIYWDGSLTRFDNVSLLLNESPISIQGKIVSGDTMMNASDLDLKINMENVDLDAVQALLDNKYPCSGKFNVNMSVKGSSNSPEVALNVKADNLEYGGFQIDNLDSKMRYFNEILYVYHVEAKSGNNLSTIEGSLPLRWSNFSMPILKYDSPMSLALKLKDIPLGFMQNRIPGVEEMQGNLTIDLNIAGTPRAPKLEGTTDIEDGSFKYKPLGTVIERLNTNLRISDNTISIGRFRADSDRGQVMLGGSLSVQGSRFLDINLLVDCKDMNIIDLPGKRINGDINLKIRGSSDLPAVSGTVRIKEGDITLGKSGGTATPGVQKPIFIENFQDGSIDIEIDASEGRIFVKSETIDNAELKGTIRLKNEFSSLVYSGEMETIRGDYYLRYDASAVPAPQLQNFQNLNFVNRRLEIEKGLFTFNETKTFNPELDIEAKTIVTYDATDYEITVRITGELDELEIEFSSDPPQEETNILSLLVLGRPFNVFQDDPSVLSDVIAAATASVFVQAALQQVLVGRQGVIDIVTVEPVGDELGSFEDLRFMISKYFNLGKKRIKNLRVNVSQRFGATPETQVNVEYRVNKNLSFSSEADREGDIQVEMKVKYRY